MKYQKFLLLILAILLIFSCQSDKNDKVFRIAYAMAPGGTSHLGAVRLNELVTQKSKGRIVGNPGGIAPINLTS